MGKQLVSQMGEGIRWYYDMQENIQKLEQMLQGFSTARTVEREMFVENLKKQSEVWLPVNVCVCVFQDVKQVQQ